MDDIMKITTKILNSIRARSLQRRFFKSQLEASDSAEHTALLLHTDVRWLSRGKFLDRFQELLPEIISFLEELGDDTHLLQNEKWLSDLAFLSDLTNHLNVLNLELQAPAHYNALVNGELDELFPERWIGRDGPVHWPPRSPELNKVDFFFWCYIKDVVYRTSPTTADDVKIRIKDAFQSVT
ncbi:protein FAM200A-like [Diabrotica virgifera virgifera]|uniref:Zinc finger BED domain-containing protein 5-like n=1 Tax=Diabrotica virgifera virgifera TaxID=50390 RepID=A0ABM5KFW6_DIAVI|nr:protein FAM200A-like [Diabrotica virgifera virgifera]